MEPIFSVFCLLLFQTERTTIYQTKHLTQTANLLAIIRRESERERESKSLALYLTRPRTYGLWYSLVCFICQFFLFAVFVTVTCWFGLVWFGSVVVGWFFLFLLVFGLVWVLKILVSVFFPCLLVAPILHQTGQIYIFRAWTKLKAIQGKGHFCTGANTHIHVHSRSLVRCFFFLNGWCQYLPMISFIL